MEAVKTVFISYQRRDGEFARMLEERLTARGIRVWRDVNSISLAENFPQVTGEAIAQCDLVILLWTKGASNSRFITTEWNTALALHKQICPVFHGKPYPLPPALSAFNGMSGKDVDALVGRIEGKLAGGEEKAGVTTATVRPLSRRLLIRMAVVAGIVLGAFVLIAWKWAKRLHPGMALVTSDSTSRPSVEPLMCIDSILSSSTKSLADFDSSQKRSSRGYMVSGYVYDAANGLPLPGVKVYADVPMTCATEKREPCTTDAGGHFSVLITPGHSRKDVLLEFEGPPPYGRETYLVNTKGHTRLMRVFLQQQTL